jgi:phage shock protein PspC (stress-responsive transcriptional regulator)
MARKALSRHPRRMTTHHPHPAPPRRLTRSTSDKVLGGVAGGLAEHLSLDPAVVRVAFAVSTLFGGAGVVAYVVLWAFAPADVDGAAPSEATPATA